MAKTVKEVRLNRLIDERQTVAQLDDSLLASVESREGEQNLTEIEAQQHDGYRARSADLDAEIASLTEDLKREADSLRAQKLARAHLAGDGVEGVELDGEHVRYRTFATYARDYILARGVGNAAEQIRGTLGGKRAQTDAQERLGRMLGRTPANTLSSDVSGLIPDDHIAQIMQVIDKSRPLVASLPSTGLDRGRLSYPVLEQRPVVAAQSAEKTEAGNQKMIVSMEETTATTYLGGGDLSWQAINWSSPNALSLWFDLAAESYAEFTEADASQVLSHSAFSFNIDSGLLGGTPTFAEFMTAVGLAGAEVFDNSRRMINTAWMAVDRFWYLFGLTTEVQTVFANVGSDRVGPVSFVPSPGLDAGVIIVGDRNGALVAETEGAPVELRAVEPAIGGLEVGIIGAFEAVVTDPGAFAMITTAS